MFSSNLFQQNFRHLILVFFLFKKTMETIAVKKNWFLIFFFFILKPYIALEIYRWSSLLRINFKKN